MVHLLGRSSVQPIQPPQLTPKLRLFWPFILMATNTSSDTRGDTTASNVEVLSHRPGCHICHFDYLKNLLSLFLTTRATTAAGEM